jgi:hypothetical protein
MTEQYLVPTYPVVKHKLLGTEKWAELATKHSNGALWNNGTFVQRDIRGKPGQISNHARGVAMDLSWRRIEARGLGVNDGRRKAITFLQLCLDNWKMLGIQCVLDYFPEPHGRGWRCDRVGIGVVKPHAFEAWVKYGQATIHGAPKGDWLHIEITRQMADDPGAVERAFRAVFTTPPQ